MRKQSDLTVSVPFLLLASLFFQVSAGFAKSYPIFNQPPFEQIRTSILRFDFTEARRLLPVKPLKGESEAVRLFYSMQISAWMYLLTEDDAQFQKFETSWTAMDQYLGTQTESDEILFLKGEGTLWRAIVQVRKNDFISAAWNARSAYKYYESANERTPGNPDLLKGLGIFHFMIGTVPARYSWLASITGFSGSMAQGRAELEKAAQAGTFSRDEALFFLSGIDLFVDKDPGKAIRKLDDLLFRYPENGVFLLVKSIAYQRNREIRKSVELMEAKYESIKKTSPAFSDQVLFRIAEGYFFENNFSKAIPLLQEFINGNKALTNLTLAKFRLALSYELSGQHDQAAKWFGNLEPRKQNDFETYASEEGKKWVKKPMSPAEKSLWIGRNYFDSGSFDEALLSLLDARKSAGKSSEVIAEADFRLGRIYEELKQPDLALQYYRSAERSDLPEQSWIEPFSLFQQGKVLVKTGKKAEAETAMRKALAAEDHVFVNSLSREIETELRKMGVTP